MSLLRAGHDSSFDSSTLPRAGCALLLRLAAALTLAVILAMLIGPASAFAQSADVTDNEVRQTVAKAVAKLKSTQKQDGHWEVVNGRYGGMTALALLALLQAGVPLDDPVVKSGLAALDGVPDSETYVVALRLMVMARVDQLSDQPRYARQIPAAIRWLETAQTDQGTWGYNSRAGGAAGDAGAATLATDNSNTQFALLGLYEAARAGYKVEEVAWKRSEDHFVRTQWADGGWAYRDRAVDPTRSAYGSMTATGLASLLITGSRLQEGSESGFQEDGAAKNCGQYRQSQPVAQALRWLDKNFSVARHPGLEGSWHFYYLFAVERVGMLSGQRYIGGHDWFREGADYLVSRQLPDGSFKHQNDRGAAPDYDTAFALLFLSKGHVPALVNKLRWGKSEADWNSDRYDVEHLTRWLGDRLSGQAVGWQTLAVEAPFEEYLAAPILYITGHKAPSFTKEQQAKLRRYVEQGGTILAEACCGQKDFADGMRKLAATLFPEGRLETLPGDHPIYHSVENLPPAWPLEGLSFGCRVSFILSPRDLSCRWEQSSAAESLPALKLGLNLAAYATAREPLRGRLAKVEVVAAPPELKFERRTLYIGKVLHKGDCDSRPQAMERLLESLRQESGVKVANRTVPIGLADAKLFQYPVIYMVGHTDPQLSAEEKAGLKRFLEHGGFLMAEACCGRPEFDQAFRVLMAELFPESPLAAVPLDSALFNGEVGYKIGQVSYSRRLREEQPGLTEPRLEGIKTGDRYMVIYSPYALGPGLDGVATWQSRGYEPAAARQVAMNIVLYALKY